MTVTDSPVANLALDEFVKLPGSEHMELLDGLPVSKWGDEWREEGEEEQDTAYAEHIIQCKFARFLEESQDNEPRGYAAVEGLIQIYPNDPRRGRRPDAFFIGFETLAGRDIHDPFLAVCPDICIEIVSPNDTSWEVAQKVSEYSAAGAKLVWEVQSHLRAVIVHRPDGIALHVRGDELLSGEDVLPAFAVPVSKLFPKAVEPAE